MILSRLPIEYPSWFSLFGFQFGVEKDLISELSDDVLISIIARVETKEAVRTSILSNRWRHLYKSVPDVDLSWEHVVGHSHDSNTFIDAICRFLSLRLTKKIRSFKLTSCCMNSTTDRFEKLIQSLGRLGIQKLTLSRSCCMSYPDHSFPCHFVSHLPSLEILDLVNCSLTSLKLTQSNSTLGVVMLYEVWVVDGALECILANCLSLQSLSISSCKLPFKLFVCGENLQLKHLWMRRNRRVEEIEFNAGNLVTFEIFSLKVVNFIFDHVPKMQSMYVNFVNKNTMSSNRTLGAFLFSELRQLSLCLYAPAGLNLLSLAPYLASCPRLQELHLDTELLKSDDGEEVTELDVAVFHPELKKVEMTGHAGTKSEIQFALYILKSAISLEQMLISRCPLWYCGHGTWRWREKLAWNKVTLQMIHRQLQGQAISEKAQLTIQHSPVYE